MKHIKLFESFGNVPAHMTRTIHLLKNYNVIEEGEYDVDGDEKSFLKEQSKDLARIIPLVAISGIPIPIPITPLLIMLGKKYGFDFLPKDHRGLLKDDEEIPPVEDK